MFRVTVCWRVGCRFGPRHRAGDDEYDSRSFTDAALAQLRAGGWRPGAWRRFGAAVTRRSIEQIAHRPRAAAEVTALHIALLAVRTGPGGRAWIAASWVLAVTHLGMLGARPGLGAANALTLARANLPAILPDRPALAAVLAAVSDLADGRVSRSTGTTTLFGAQADALSDAVVWTWLALRHEPSRAFRTATLVGWVAVVGGVATASFARGAMIDPPRPKFVRPSALMQAALTARALWRIVKRRR